jgi:hypothetical protein
MALSMSVSTDILRHGIRKGRIFRNRAQVSRFASSAFKEACAIASVLLILMTIMAIAALLDIWMWLPRTVQ